MASLIELPPKSSASVVPVTVDFISQLDLANDEAVVAVVPVVTISSGVDPSDLTAMVSIPGTLSQNTFTQFVSGGVDGVIYLLSFNATTNLDNQVIIQAYLAVLSTNPY